MVSTLPLILSVAALLSLSSLTVDAHSAMAVPKVTFPQGYYDKNSPFGHIDSEQFTEAAKSFPSWKGSERASAAMSNTNTKTLRAFIMNNVKISIPAATKECGMTLATGDKQPLPDTVDFPWVHPGPCEIWCDNTRFFHNANCWGNKVGKVPVDKAKCQGASFIQGLYLGVHIPNWEIYANCAPLIGGTETDVTKALAVGASGTNDESANDATSAPTKVPAPTKAPAAPATPTPTTAPTRTPVTPPATPSKAPATPSASSKCNVRRD